MDAPIAQGDRVEDVLRDGGQIDLVVNGQSALVAREDEQRRDGKNDDQSCPHARRPYLAIMASSPSRGQA